MRLTESQKSLDHLVTEHLGTSCFILEKQVVLVEGPVLGRSSDTVADEVENTRALSQSVIEVLESSQPEVVLELDICH